MEKTITIKLTEEQHRQAKIAAAHAGMTLKEIFMSAIRRLEEMCQSEQIEIEKEKD